MRAVAYGLILFVTIGVTAACERQVGADSSVRPPAATAQLNSGSGQPGAHIA